MLAMSSDGAMVLYVVVWFLGLAWTVFVIWWMLKVVYLLEQIMERSGRTSATPRPPMAHHDVPDEPAGVEDMDHELDQKLTPPGRPPAPPSGGAS